MGHRAVAIDLPGFGNTYSPARSPDIHNYAKVQVKMFKYTPSDQLLFK